MAAVQDTVDRVKAIDVSEYKYGFITDIESDKAPKGLSEEIVRFISAKKNEPVWLTEWRLEAYRRWLTMESPDWSRVKHPPINYQDLYYYSAPKSTPGPKSLDEVDPELLRTYAKLGIPLREQELLAGVEPSSRVAVDAVFDSVSVATTFKAELARSGVIFCPISEAVHSHPELVRKYLGSVVPVTDNYYATLNSAVFSDGSFVYIPPGVRCPMELSTYFRINEKNTGQFERTLIIADKGSYVSYLEGCTAPMRDENQLHAAVVELVALEDAEIKYSTVQNWYPGDANGKGGIYNFVTKRGDCREARAKISWTQVETGSAITWKYPSCILRGDGSRGEFYSIAISNGMQQVDSGTKMIHLGRDTTSRIISKGIAAGRSDNTYRGLVSAHRKAKNARNFTNCDSLLIGEQCGAHTVPVYRGQDRIGGLRARGHDLEDLRGPAVLLPPAWAVGRGGHGAHRQRLRSRRASAVADGVRGRGAEADRHLARRQRRLTSPLLRSGRRSGDAPPIYDKVHGMLEVKNLHVEVEGKKILNGLDLAVRPGEVAAIMGPNGSGKSTLSYVIAGRADYDVTAGEVSLDGENVLEMDPEERAAKGLFLAFQYPVEIPGVATMTFLKASVNAQRKARGRVRDVDA